jgi:hypothetical protein
MPMAKDSSGRKACQNRRSLNRLVLGGGSNQCQAEKGNSSAAYISRMVIKQNVEINELASKSAVSDSGLRHRVMQAVPGVQGSAGQGV